MEALESDIGVACYIKNCDVRTSAERREEPTGVLWALQC